MDLLISGVDLFTAVGATAEITYFSVRSGLNQFTETGAMNRQREPRIAAVLPGFRHHRDEARLASFAAESAVRALEQAGIPNGCTVGVALCMPGPQRPDAPATFELWQSTFGDAFSRVGIVSQLRAFVEAPGSTAHVVQDAAVRLERGEENVTLVGGADSWVSLRALRWLEERGRLKLEDRAEGLIPGEAAGFVVLESASARVGSQRPLAVLRASGVAREPGHYDSGEPCLSIGYTRAARTALSGIDPQHSPRVLLSDLNGESYKAKEWAAAEVRLMPQSPDIHLHPADCFGDVGSMAAIAQLAVGAVGLSRGEWTGSVMVVAGSEGSARGVMIAESLQRGGRLEPDLEVPIRTATDRVIAREMSSILVDEHLEEAGYLRLQRRLAERRSAEPWCGRDGFDRRHAWHLLALAASVPQAESTLVQAMMDGDRAPEDRAAAVAALALAAAPSALRGTWILMHGTNGLPVALREALDDLPNPIRQALRRSLAEHADTRVRKLADDVFPHVAAEQILLEIAPDASVDQREQAAALITERSANGADLLLDSPQLRLLLKPETIAWVTIRGGRVEGIELARHLSRPEITPRLLVALGAAGDRRAIPLLLEFVADAQAERADAAGASLALMTGVEIIESAGEEDAGDEVWSRSADRWREALRNTFGGRSLPDRMLMGAEWSRALAEHLRADPGTRNGVRRALAAAISPTDADQSATCYYWEQGRTTG